MAPGRGGTPPPTKAVVVALNILREGVHLMRESTSGLMDEALDAESLAQVQAVPDRKIKKSRGALFNYLIQKHAKETVDRPGH